MEFICKKSLTNSLSSEEEDPENLTNEELLVEYEKLRSEINNLTEVKKWGLVWKDQPQDVILDWKDKFPILEVENQIHFKKKNLPTNLLIQGDNYNSLSVLNYTHREKIDMIYIDPPYNTAGNLNYNNDYQAKDHPYTNSLFLSILYHRLKIALNLLKPNGVICCTIDDKELLAVLGIFEKLNLDVLAIVTIRIKPEGRVQADHITASHEYAIFASSQNSEPVSRRTLRRDMEFVGDFKLQDTSNRRYRTDTFYRRGDVKTNPTTEPRWYPIYVNPKSNSDKNEPKKYFEISRKKKKGWKEIFPVDTNGSKFIWNMIPEKFDEAIKNQDPNDPDIFALDGKILTIHFKIFQKFFTTPISTWAHKDHNPQPYGNKLVTSMINEKFSYPKSVFAVFDCLDIFLPEDGIVLDFFGGSGTTGHATQLLNQRDNDLHDAFVGKYGNDFPANPKFLFSDAKLFAPFDITNKDNSSLTEDEISEKWTDWKNNHGKRRFIVCTNNEIEDLEPDKLFTNWRKGKTFEQLTPAQQAKELNHPDGICRKITFPRLKQITKGFASSEDVALKITHPITSLKKFMQTDLKNYWIFGLNVKHKPKTPPILFNMIHFRIDYSPAKFSFASASILTKRAVPLFLMKEDCFYEVQSSETFSIHMNDLSTKYVGIVFNSEGIEKITPLIQKIKFENPNVEFIVYIFTTDKNDNFDNFEEVKHLITINSTPSDIYTTYSAVQGEYFDD